MTEKKREVNLELLRIIAMLMVISLHYLGKGNTMAAGITAVSPTDPNFINEVLAWTLEALSYGAVNLYVMISGYFLINSMVRMEKVWKLIVQVLFYSIGIFLIFLSIGQIPADMQGSFYHYGIMIFPFTSQHYWFASIYLILYLLAPFIAIGLRKTNKKQTFALVVILLLCFSRVLKYFFPNMVMHDEQGYGIIWMTVVFVIAVYIRRFVPVKPKRRWLYLGIFFGASALTVCGTFGLALFYNMTGHLQNFVGYLYGYNSPTVIAASVGLFLFFRTLPLSDKGFGKVILFVAPLTFGIYLLHEHYLLRDLWIRLWKVDVVFRTPLFILHYIGVVLAVFIIGAIVEWLRKLLFGLLDKTKPMKAFYRLLGKLDGAFPPKDEKMEEAE
jgi:surface polysaccharide O-acyltransferase-like enzyme